MNPECLTSLKVDPTLLGRSPYPVGSTKIRIGFAFLILLAFNLVCSETTSKPNVIVLMADDLGWGDLSSNGNQEVSTPNLDILAESGLNFEKFYTFPNGSSSSAAFLTGRYPYRTGVAGESQIASMMYGSENTVAEVFADNQYDTSYFGRWHHGKNWPQNAKGQGFQSHTDQVNSDAIVQQLNKALEASKPFYCHVYFPYPRIEKAEPKEIAAELEQLDEEVGKLLGWLINENLAKDTVVIFTSDNGPDGFGNRSTRYNGYFYGGKGSVHEGGIRVPCFVSWPGKISAGSRFTRITSPIDWMPTLVELCDLKLSNQRLRWDGSSFAKALLNEGDSSNWPNRILFHSWTPPNYDIRNASVSVRTDRWVALRDPNWRRDESLVENQSGWELYDLKSDPYQKTEMGKKYPFLLSELRADFAFWMDNTTDDGIGPISIEVGHVQSPRVELPIDDILKWRLKIVNDKSYVLTLSGRENCKVRIGDEALVLKPEVPVRYNFQSGKRYEVKVEDGKPEGLFIELEKD